LKAEGRIAVSSFFGDVFIYHGDNLDKEQQLQLLYKVPNKDKKNINLEWNEITGHLLLFSSDEVIEVFLHSDEMFACIYHLDAGNHILAATYTATFDEIIAITSDNHILKWTVAKESGVYWYIDKMPCYTTIYNDIAFDTGKRKCIFSTSWQNHDLFHDVVELDLETGKPLNRFRTPRDVVSSLSYINEGSAVLIDSQAGFVYQFSTETGELLYVFPRTPGGIIFSGFSAHGDKLLCHSGNGILHEFSFDNLICINQVKQHDFYITGAFYDNRNNLISVAGNGEIKCWENDTGQSILITTLPDAPYQIQPMDNQFLVVRYFSPESKEKKIDLLNILSFETTPVLQTSSDNLIILCAGARAFFVQENRNTRSAIYYCDVE